LTLLGREDGRIEIRGTPVEHLEENPREMRPSTIFRTYGINSAVVNELHWVNPV